VVHVVGNIRNTYILLIGYPSAKRPRGRPTHAWKDNLKWILTGMGFGDVEWFHTAQERDR
jgi:hypothetical protein